MSDTVISQLVLFNQLYKQLDELYHTYAKSCGLSDSAFWILYSIKESDEIYTQKELCELWFYSRQTVNSTLKSLEKQGIVQLTAAPGDRKSKQIILTSNGEDLAQAYIIPLLNAEEAAFGKLSSAEREEFLRLTKKHVALFRTETEKLKGNTQ